MARPRKNTYTMEQYLKNLNEGYISNDADTQRNPAWKPIVDGLAVTILTDNYVPVIILAEEDNSQIHIVDGGSRTGAFRMIRYGNYKIKSSVENPIISYKKKVVNANGKIEWEDAEFDIRHKTFADFPMELQKKFDEYQIDTVIHEHCTKEDIAMYIKRYNVHKAMTSNQAAFLYLPRFAEIVRAITRRQFFIDKCEISETEKENGILERIVAEAVMVMNHLDKWKNNGKKITAYLNENETEESFQKLNDNIEILESIVTDETKCLFNTKNSFVWLAAFDKFKSLGLDDNKFGDFLKAFINGLRNREVDGKLFDRVDDTGSTKDKANIVAKLHIIETLMNEFFNIKEVEETEEINVLDFVKENVKADATDEDIELYEDILSDLTLEVDNNTKLLDKNNLPSLIGLVGYAIEKDIDSLLTQWIVNFFAQHFTYNANQKENLSYMCNSIDQMWAA